MSDTDAYGLLKTAQQLAADGAVWFNTHHPLLA